VQAARAQMAAQAGPRPVAQAAGMELRPVAVAEARLTERVAILARRREMEQQHKSNLLGHDMSGIEETINFTGDLAVKVIKQTEKQPCNQQSSNSPTATDESLSVTSDSEKRAECPAE
jgi:hypothetical protein